MQKVRLSNDPKMEDGKQLSRQNVQMQVVSGGKQSAGQ